MDSHFGGMLLNLECDSISLSCSRVGAAEWKEYSEGYEITIPGQQTVKEHRGHIRS
jgi:hypothetical protein